MEKDIITLADRLKEIEDRLRNNGEVRPWRMVWLLMVGSCYSLKEALPYLNSSRELQKQIDCAKNLLEQLKIKEDSINEGGCASWVVGYYLYSAEQRISSSFHRLLKTYQNKSKSKEDAHKLVEKILRERKCPASNSTPILEKFNSKKGEGGCLNRVWDRVNDIKHEASEETNPECPEARWKDAFNGLCGLCQIFEDFAEHRGIFKKQV